MIATPVLLSLATALLILIFRRNIPVFRGVSFLGSGLNLTYCLYLFNKVYHEGAQRLHFGGWESPFAITFHVDTLSAVMLSVAAVVGLSGNIIAVSLLNPRLELRGFHSLYHFMMMGVFGAFATGDLFNLYVWFEIILISSFLFVVLSRQGHAYAGGFKYTVLSMIGSLFFLIGVAFVYSSAGTLDLQDLSYTLSEKLQGPQMMFAVFFLGFAFSLKAGLFPFYYWLPAAYTHTATPVAAVFSGLLTKVGVYALLRVLVAPALAGAPDFFQVLTFIALASMVLGVLGALAQDNMKGILSFHIISQVGYIVLALSFGSSFGVVACVFYLVHHIIVKTNLFFITAYIETMTGTAGQLIRLGNLWEKAPLIAILFAVSALSLIGMPPLSGFWAKVLTLQAALGDDRWISFFACLAVSLLTLMSMLKIWLAAFWKPSTGPLELKKLTGRQQAALLPIVILTLWTIVMGNQVESFKHLGEKISAELKVERIQK